MIDAIKGTELSAAAQKQLSPSAEVQSWANEAVAILWHSAQQIKSRTVTLNISLNAELNKTQVGENFAQKKGLVSFCSKLLLAEAPARGRVSNVVANLCVKGKLDTVFD